MSKSGEFDEVTVPHTMVILGAAWIVCAQQKEQIIRTIEKFNIGE
ncbi:MAG: hypothetical protein P8N21_00020 [Opitutales bacterium]|nr:hypothetical protein [Opitutales bacterium]